MLLLLLLLSLEEVEEVVALALATTACSHLTALVFLPPSVVEDAALLLGDDAVWCVRVDLALDMAAAAAAAAALRVVCRVVWTGAGITGCFPEMAALEDEDA